MKISTRGRYALRFMLDLAQQPKGEFISLNGIAERQGISKKYLEQIIPLLNKAGFLQSIRGFKGGYRLIGKPSSYTVGQVLKLTEGSLDTKICLDMMKDDVMLMPVWEGLYENIENYLDSYTLQDILDDYNKKNTDMYII